MTHNSERNGKKIGSPAIHFESPGDVVEDKNHQFGQVVRAIEQVGEKPKHKPSQ